MSTVEYTAEDVLKRHKQTQKTKPEVVPETTPAVPDAPKEYKASDIIARYNQGFSKPTRDNSIPKAIESSLSQRIVARAEKRSDKVKTVLGAAFADVDNKTLEQLVKRPGISEVLQASLGNTVGTIADTTGEVIMSGLGTASNFFIDLVLPEDTQGEVKGKFIEGFNWLTSTDAGKEAIAQAKSGVESYNKWASDNPVSAVLFESVIDIGTFFAPPVKRAVLPPSLKVTPPAHRQVINAASEQVDKLKSVFENRATRKYKEENLEAAYQYVMPIKLDESRLSDVTPRKFTRKAKLEPNQLEAESIEWVSGLRGLKPSKGMLYNYKVIDGVNKQEAQILKLYLNRKGKDIFVSRDTMNARVTNTIRKTIADEPLANTRDARGQINAIVDGVNTLIAKHDTNPAGVLALRQDLDKYLEKKFKFFTKEQPVWLDNLGKTLRNDLNEMINEVMPDDFVKESLRRQHLGFTTMRGLGPKAVKDTDAEISSHFSNLKRDLGEQVRDSRLVGFATVGAAGYSAAMGVMPYIAGATAGLGISYYMIKGFRSPEMSKGIAYALDMTNKAIKQTNNPDMLRDLRVGRSTLLEVMKLPLQQEAPVEQEEQEKEPKS
jgi:hypothetical protein